MVIGVLQFELLIPWAGSLKDKRRVVSSVKDRLHRQHLVSIAEVAGHDVLNVAVMGLAVVARDGRRAADVLDRIEAKLRGSMTDAELGETQREILSGRSGQMGGDVEPKPDPADTSRRRAVTDEVRQMITEEDIARIAAELDGNPSLDGRLDG